MDISSVIEIRNAVRYPILIKDPYLANFKVENRVSSGQPIEWTGAFSAVYPMVSDKEKCILKIWFIHIDNNEQRYSELKEYLENKKLPYFVKFDYIRKGIIVEGEPLDMLRMEWVDAVNLTEYISAHLHDKSALEKLANNFKVMFEDLHKHKISHGDLQPDNIKITSDGQIKLIDYDSVCIPKFLEIRDFCKGTPGYQSPSRIISGFISSLNMDYFSQLVIYITIKAVIENHLIWDSYSVTQADDRLLFKAEDFFDWEYSDIRRDLNFLSQEIKDLVKILDSYINAHLFLPPFISLI